MHESPDIIATHTPWIARYYAILARIDLVGKDAANLHRQGVDPRDDTLTAHYCSYAAREQLLLQMAPLTWREGPGELLEQLARTLSPEDPLWKTLAREVRGARGQKIEDFLAPRSPHLAATERALGALYESNPHKRPARIVIHDVPTMRDGIWTHGRATQDGEEVHVALSTHADEVCSALQLFHELTHFVTDPLVLATHNASHTQATHVQSAGYALHSAMEACVVEVDAAIITARVPEWQSTFQRWRARYGV